MNIDLSQLHFIRPLYLALVLIIIAVWFLARRNLGGNKWEDHLPKQVIETLQMSLSKVNRRWQWCLLWSFITITIAAAGPTWNKHTIPAVQNQSAIVIALDLSPSMVANDLSPDRLTLAKFKLIDILRKHSDAQIALVAYAGEAHVVSPLTDDPRTIEALLPALHPEVMPSSGSNIESAIELANKLLSDAGAASGEVLVISDGISTSAIKPVKALWNSQHRLSILAVGSDQGVPIPEQGGGFLRNSNGEIVLAKVNRNEMRELALSLGGGFAVLSADESDINKLLRDHFEQTESSSILQLDDRFDDWQDMGHLLLILALPLLLLCFRKGLIYCLPLAFILPFDNSAIAQTQHESEKPTAPGLAPHKVNNFESIWNSLWKTSDQQAAELFKQKKYKEAASKFKREDWSNVAHYKAGNYKEAAGKFNSPNNRDLYNKGNALALSGDLEQALLAYQQVLKQDEEHQDALHNKNVVEQLLQRQKDQNQDQNKNQDQERKQSEDQQNSQNQDGGSSEESESSESKNESDKQQSDDQNESQSEQQNSQQQESNQDAHTGEEEQPNEENESQPKQNENAEEGQDSEQKAGQPGEQSQEQEADSPQEETSQAVGIDETDDQLEDSSEQWLRSIKDDPSGLLRRKFEYQSRQRLREGQTVNNDEERF